MRTTYLIWSFTAFLAWLILEKMDSEIKWIALGVGGTMLLFGIFMKENINPIEETEDKILNNLNKTKEGNKNDI